MLLRLLRQFSAVIAKDLAAGHALPIAAQPGRVLFPKRIHELGELEGDAPNGLSIEFIRLVVEKNAAALRSEPAETAVATLAAHVSEQIGAAVLLERTIVERLKAAR